jgi:protein O-mannosyl-transferase
MSGNKKPSKQREKKPVPPATKPSAGTQSGGGQAKRGRQRSTLAEKPLDWKKWLIGALVVAITGIVFSGVTKLHWTNWDDDEYIYENPMVMNAEYGRIFTEAVNNNYNPLPVAMFAWEWQLMKAKKGQEEKTFEEKAWIFHVNNLWMHLLCTALVFVLMLQLGLNPVWAGFAALLFGIHPLRVESVAWITERKDVMFGTFYVGALLAYIQYLKGMRGPGATAAPDWESLPAEMAERRRSYLWLGLCAVLFVGALFSKIQAVSLPLSMLAIDWYRRREWKLGVILDKVPFFIGSLAIGIYGFSLLAKGETIDATETFAIHERMVLGFASFAVYIVKALVPYEVCTFYPYPEELTDLHYIGAIAAAGIVAGAVLLRKISRETTFGIVFFAVNIVFLLQIVGAGSAYLADRFTYMAYIGLFFALAMVLQRLVAARKHLVPVAVMAALPLLAVSVYQTWKYIPAWQNSITLWTDVIDKYPEKVVLAYVNRGQMVRRDAQKQREGETQAQWDARRQLQTEQAFQDFNTAIKLKGTYHLGYLNRGNIYFDRGENEKALADYTKVIELNSPINFKKKIEPAVGGAYSNRGGINARMGKYPEAIADLEMALKVNKAINVQDKNVWNNLAATHSAANNHPKAVEAFTEYLRFQDLTPVERTNALNGRGFSYMQVGKWNEAITDFNAAIAQNPNDGRFYYNRAVSYFNLGNKANAQADAKKAQSLNYPVDPGFLQVIQQ